MRMLMFFGSLRRQLQTAADWIGVGNKEEGKKILQRLLDTYAEKQSLYSDAVNIYAMGKMFTEAKEVFELYRSRFGKELHSDFSVADIDKELNAKDFAIKEYESSPVKVFKRMSAFERGRFSNLPMIMPIKQISLSANGLVLLRGKKAYRYTWADIQDAFITNRPGYKGARFGENVIRTLNLKMPDRTFKFDVSANYPDFKHNDILLTELRKRTALREE